MIKALLKGQGVKTTQRKRRTFSKTREYFVGTAQASPREFIAAVEASGQWGPCNQNPHGSDGHFKNTNGDTLNYVGTGGGEATDWGLLKAKK